MLICDEFDNFQIEYAPEILFSYASTLSLDAFLEFIIVDSNGLQLSIEDNSQLYFSMSIYDNHSELKV